MTTDGIHVGATEQFYISISIFSYAVCPTNRIHVFCDRPDHIFCCQQESKNCLRSSHLEKLWDIFVGKWYPLRHKCECFIKINNENRSDNGPIVHILLVDCWAFCKTSDTCRPRVYLKIKSLLSNKFRLLNVYV